MHESPGITRARERATSSTAWRRAMKSRVYSVESKGS